MMSQIKSLIIKKGSTEKMNSDDKKHIDFLQKKSLQKGTGKLKPVPQNIRFPKKGMIITLGEEKFRIISSDYLKGNFSAKRIKI